MVFDAKKPPTIQEAITAGSQIMMTKEQVETWWHKRDADGWTIHRNNGRQTPITNWRKDLAASKAWAAMSGSKDKPQAPRKRNFTSDDVGI